MAIVQMKRLTMAVIRSQKEALLKELLKRGCVEFSEIDGLVAEANLSGSVWNESSDLMELKQNRAVLQRGIELLERYVPKKNPLLAAKPEIEKELLLEDNGLMGSVKFAEEMIAKEERIRQIVAEESRQKAILESLRPWIPLNMPLNSAGTEYAAVLIGTLPARFPLADVARSVEDVTEEAQLYSVSEDRTQHYVMIICLRQKVTEVQDALRRYSYTASAFSGIEGSAKEETGKAELTLKRLATEKAECKAEIEAEAVRRDEMKLAADKLTARIAIAGAEEQLYRTDTTCFMAGWIPAEREEELKEVFGNFVCAYETREPTEDEYPVVPVQLKNNKVTDGLNMVTGMYSLPAYGTVDANPLMAPFFILFYGLMMADMGYGILMVLAALVAMAKIKPEGGTLSFCRLLLWCGVSTFAMGILTGGFFSDAPKQVYDIVCRSRGIEPVWQGLPKLFSPTEDSIAVLIGAMVLGWIHLNTGMVISFVQKWKAGKKGDALWEEGALWVLLLGAAVFILKKTGLVPGIPQPVAVAALVIGLAVLLFGAGRNAKGFGKVTAAFGCIYNTATGWFGDILSYSRVMALMLAGGVIGQVFNTVAIMPAQSKGINAVTVIAFLVIFLLGHAMNFGLNLLGCFVHDLRLQCLEFFGKFYQDGGKPFKPLKFVGKYVKVKQE